MLLKNLDFTLFKYESICRALASSHYVNTTFEEYFNRGLKKEGTDQHYIILRHDVDENCKYALGMAFKEYQYGLKATYYFRMKPKTYIPSMIDNIARFNHEIGYHYETVDTCRGNIRAASQLFGYELGLIRQRYNVKTACMHGNPLTKYDNKAIWKEHELSHFGLIGEPYLSLDYNKFAYFSDSGRTWAQDPRRKLKDRINGFNGKFPRSTDELIEIIRKEQFDNICLLAHPIRWPANMVDFVRRYLIDMAYVGGKYVIYLVRN